MSWAARVAVIASVWAIFPTAAHAYLDPGTGALLLQAAIASALTAAAAIKFQSQKLKHLISRLVSRLRSRSARPIAGAEPSSILPSAKQRDSAP